MRSLRTEKDKHIEALKTVLEDNKKRNADFMRTIEVEFKKKEEVVDGLHRAVRELQERNRGLEEQNDKLVEELEQARRRLEDKQ
jgi:chromosome segregation ATPase